MLAGSTAIAEMRSGKEGARSRGFGAYVAQPAIESAEITHAYRCAVLETLEKYSETGIIDRFPTSRSATIDESERQTRRRAHHGSLAFGFIGKTIATEPTRLGDESCGGCSTSVRLPNLLTLVSIKRNAKRAKELSCSIDRDGRGDAHLSQVKP